MMRIKMKNPSLDQTGDPRDEEKEKSQSQQALQKKRRPRPLASLLKGLNLVLLMINLSQKLLSILQADLCSSFNEITFALTKQADLRSSFNEMMDTPVDLSAFLMNRLKVYTLTHELLAGPTYKLMKGSSKSLMELEFFLKEVYKATTDQLDWNNPEG
nr:hypothetical protein [Tanacetum cinerariifolium]